MYSPKIDPILIPDLYRLARAVGVPMTALVNRALRDLVSQPQARAAIARATIPPKYDHTWRRAKAG